MRIVLVLFVSIFFSLPQAASACSRMIVKITETFKRADVVVEGTAYFSEPRQGGILQARRILKGENRPEYVVVVRYEKDASLAFCGYPKGPRGQVKGRFFLKKRADGKFEFIHLGDKDY
jgi:hypothetical protein